MSDRLKVLAERYRAARQGSDSVREAVHECYGRFADVRRKSLLDAAASASAVARLVFADRIDFDAINPKMREAFELAFPNESIDNLRQLTPEQINGFINPWKGKYFEILVRDRLNAGDTVGGLALGPGQEALLAAAPNQPGFDLVIQNADGAIVDQFQVKATDSIAYVKEALERYPEIEVLATDEAVRENIEGLLRSSGFSNEQLESTIEAPLENVIDGPLEEFFESVILGLPFVIIAVGEGRHILAGTKAPSEVLKTAGFRTAKSGVATGVGILLTALGAGAVSIPAAFLTRIGFDRTRAMKIAAQAVERRLDEALVVRERYAAGGILPRAMRQPPPDDV